MGWPGDAPGALRGRAIRDGRWPAGRLGAFRPRRLPWLPGIDDLTGGLVEVGAFGDIGTIPFALEFFLFFLLLGQFLGTFCKGIGVFGHCSSWGRFVLGWGRGPADRGRVAPGTKRDDGVSAPTITESGGLGKGKGQGRPAAARGAGGAGRGARSVTAGTSGHKCPWAMFQSAASTSQGAPKR